MYKDKDDYHCKSSIDESKTRDGCVRFLWEIRTWIHYHPAGKTWGTNGRTFRCQDWLETEQKKFEDAFKKSIENGWGRGAIWLTHTQRDQNSLWFDIDIKFVTERKTAHLCVNAVTGPKGRPELIAYRNDANGKPENWPFRGGCKSRSEPVGHDPIPYAEEDMDSDAPLLKFPANPIDMHMPYHDVVDGPNITKAKDDNNEWYYTEQFSHLHEFGHYIGLNHPCGNSYCGGHSRSVDHLENLMAIGMALRWYHGDQIAKRLKEHHTDFLGPEHRIFPFVAQGVTIEGGGERSSRPWQYDAKFLRYLEQLKLQKEAERKKKREGEGPTSWLRR